MKDKKSSPFQMRAAALAVASCLAITPWAAEAASLGKITVLSALGQPLRAEIELAASREELVGMTAKLASRDTAQQAGVDLLPVVSDLRFAIDKRASGTTVVKVTSGKPVNEPFLDFFIELNWPSGRLVREYVFLLDPPEAAAKAAVKPVSPVEARPAVAEIKPTVKPVVIEKPVKPEKTEAPESERFESKPAERSVEKAPEKTSEKVGSDRREVKRGETLNKIANQVKPEGVSLEQMLVGLYKGNPDAFLGGNINRLRTGVVLNVPDRDAVASVTPEEARKVLKTQVADWNAYRQKLASAVAKTPVAKEEAASQTSGGKITPKVEEKAVAAEAPKDKVKVSKGEAGGKAAGKGAAEEALVAKEKALKEANERLALLEKNVNDLQKLVEMKNQGLAEAQKQAAAAKQAAEQRKQEEAKAAALKEQAKAPVAAPAKATETVKPVEAAKPVETPKPAETVKPVEAAKPLEAAKPAETAKPAEGAPVEPPKVAEPVKPVEAVQPKPMPKKPVPPPSPVPEEGLFDNPLLLAGGGGLLALLGGLFFYRRRRAQTAGVAGSNASTMPLGASTGPNSVFRNTGGQSVDTGNTTPPSTDFSQTGPGTIDTDEVDPVAEADVYMAYGRDAQAEEILLEALQKDPQRTAIHVKLLEIYANRKSNRQFETLASELYAQTGGVGAEWEKVVAMGVKLDPGNPLYNREQATGDKVAFDADATLVVSPDAMKSTLSMPGGLASMAEQATQESLEPVGAPEAGAETPLASLDFDLGAELAPAAAAESAPTAALDFDFSVEAAPVVESAATGEEVNTLDFDLGFGGEEAPAVVSAPVPASAPEPAVDFSFELPEPHVGQAPEVEPAAGMAETVIMPEPQAEAGIALDAEVVAPALDFEMDLGTVAAPEPVVDLSSISLDLGAPTEAAPAQAPAAHIDPRWDEVNTKLDLAKAYEEMGDLEGARELLQEVLSEGPPDLVEQAKAILERVGE